MTAEVMIPALVSYYSSLKTSINVQVFQQTRPNVDEV